MEESNPPHPFGAPLQRRGIFFPPNKPVSGIKDKGGKPGGGAPHSLPSSPRRRGSTVQVPPLAALKPAAQWIPAFAGMTKEGAAEFHQNFYVLFTVIPLLCSGRRVVKAHVRAGAAIHEFSESKYVAITVPEHRLPWDIAILLARRVLVGLRAAWA